MNQIATPQLEKNRGPLRVLQVVFTLLAFFFLVLGSVLMSLTWLGIGEPSTSGNELRFIAVIVYLAATLFIVWLLSTIALLLARQWIAALLALPAAVVIFIVFYLFLVFILAPISGAFFVLLLILLNGAVLWLGFRLLKRTSNRPSGHNELRHNQ